MLMHVQCLIIGSMNLNNVIQEAVALNAFKKSNHKILKLKSHLCTSPDCETAIALNTNPNNTLEELVNEIK